MAYLAAAVLFTFSLGGLSNQETARRGNLLGILGMLLAVRATVFGYVMAGLTMMGVAIVPAVIIGAVMAARVPMTGMPVLVALLHSFVGIAAILVGISSYVSPGVEVEAGKELVHLIEIFVGVFIGAVTFTGSIIAFLKLKGSLSGKPLILPARHLLNLAAIIICILLGVWFCQSVHYPDGILPLMIMNAIACVAGVHIVVTIGGANIPVVVSMLNFYSGWAAAAAGFILKNHLLIVTGAPVGSSGAILSYNMCAAINRSFISVILGGIGTGGSSSGSAAEVEGTVTEFSVQYTVELRKNPSLSWSSLATVWPSLKHNTRSQKS